MSRSASRAVSSAGASALEQLFEALGTLYEAVRWPTVSELFQQSELLGLGVGQSTLHQLVQHVAAGNGRDDRPIPAARTVDAFVEACLGVAEHRPSSAIRSWQAAHTKDDLLDLRAEAVAQRRGSTADKSVASNGRDRPSPDAADTVRSISAWTPAHLHVRNARNEAGRADPALPRYFRRPHDDELERVLATAGSAFVVVVGDSSTGKSRSLYEAVSGHPELSRWELVFPRSAIDLLRRTARLAARTVLWLPDLDVRLSGADGDEAALALQELLSDPARGPVVVLATLWREPWATLRDDAGQVGMLLRHHATPIEMPDALTADEIRALLDDPDCDPDLRAAAATAGAGHQVIQTVTGGPDLVHRYRHPATAAEHYAHAVLTAALDALVVGVGDALSPRVVLDAAAGYLDDRHRAAPPADWARIGLDTAAMRRAGVAAVEMVRRAPGVGPADTLTLHEYLRQHGLSGRSRRPVAPPLWAALVTHVADPAALHRIAYNARRRMLYQVAEQCYRRAGTPAALVALAEMWHAAGRTDEARVVVTELGDQPDALRWRRDHSDDDTALALAERLVELTGNHGDRENLARRYAAQGRTADALREWTGLNNVRHMVELLLADGNVDDALRCAVERDDEGDWSTRSVDDILRRGGRLAELERRFRDRRDYDALGRLLAEQGRIDDLADLADRGISMARYELIDHLIEAGRAEAAEEHVAGWTQEPDMSPWDKASLWRRAGRPDRELDELREIDRAEPGNDDVCAVIAGLLVELGQIAELRERAAAPNDGRARGALASWLNANDHVQELWERAATDHHAARELTAWLDGHGRAEEAVPVWRALAETGEPWALEELVRLQITLGDHVGAASTAQRIGSRGTKYARRRRAHILRTIRDMPALVALAEEGDRHAADQSADLLLDLGDQAGLRRLALADIGSAGWNLRQLAQQHPDDAELQALRRYGMQADGSTATPPH